MRCYHALQGVYLISLFPLFFTIVLNFSSLFTFVDDACVQGEDFSLSPQEMKEEIETTHFEHTLRF